MDDANQHAIHANSFLVRISPERASELGRLAQVADKPVEELASELLEAEIEAQHGLEHGPFLRRYMYR